MKWVVLASNEVGLGLLGVFKERGLAVEALVLDPADPGGYNARLETLGAHRQLRHIGKLWSDMDVHWLQTLQADWLLLAWWSHIVGEPVLTTARLGALNLHPALLPHGAGRNPNFWTFVEGTPFGVTLHRATPRIDGGDILLQKAIPLDWTDTGGTAHAKARAAGVELFREALPKLEVNALQGRPQEASLRRYHAGGEMESASRLDLDRPTTVRELLNLLRARTFPPHPAAWFEDEGRTFEVRVELRELP